MDHDGWAYGLTIRDYDSNEATTNPSSSESTPESESESSTTTAKAFDHIIYITKKPSVTAKISQNLKMLVTMPLLISLKVMAPTVPELVYQTADGESIPTDIVIRRINTRSTEIKEVSSSIPNTISINCSNLRPTITIKTRVPQGCIIKVNVTATDEVRWN